jgi:hypothetical protein
VSDKPDDSGFNLFRKGDCELVVLVFSRGKPRYYKVLILNDDYKPIDLVVIVLIMLQEGVCTY